MANTPRKPNGAAPAASIPTETKKNLEDIRAATRWSQVEACDVYQIMRHEDIVIPTPRGGTAVVRDARPSSNFLIVSIKRKEVDTGGFSMNKEYCDCPSYPFRTDNIAQLPTLLGESFTSKDIIAALRKHPKYEEDFYLVPVSKEKLDLEKKARKHRLSQQSLENAHSAYAGTGEQVLPMPVTMDEEELELQDA